MSWPCRPAGLPVGIVLGARGHPGRRSVGQGSGCVEGAVPRAAKCRLRRRRPAAQRAPAIRTAVPGCRVLAPAGLG